MIVCCSRVAASRPLILYHRAAWGNALALQAFNTPVLALTFRNRGIRPFDTGARTGLRPRPRASYARARVTAPNR